MRLAVSPGTPDAKPWTAGTTFSQPIQAYTWLAQRLADKGAAEAGAAGATKPCRCRYWMTEGAAPFIMVWHWRTRPSADKKSALANFYGGNGSNIDFRDVASRSKALKS